MTEDRLLSKLKAGQLALGCGLRRGAYLADHLAKGGFDFFMNDMMHGGLDWAEAENMVRAGKLAGISPTLRVNSMPWSGSMEPDRHLPAEVARAVSLGYTMVRFSYSCVEEIRQCVRMGSDWHRNVPPTSGAEMLEREKQSKESVLIVPLAESLESINNIEEAMSVDGVKAFRMAASDLSIALGHPYEVDHPDVWRVMDKAINFAHKKGIWFGSGTGYMFQDVESNIKRVKRLRDHGVDFISMEGAEFILRCAVKGMVNGIKSELGCT